MNILQITSEFPPNVLGGVAYHSYNLARALVADGHSVTILTASTDAHRRDDSEFNREGIQVKRINHPDLPGTRLWFDRSARSWLAQTDLTQFDLIHSHEYVAFDRINISIPVLLKVHVNLSKELKYWTGNSIHPILRPAAVTVRKQLLRRRERVLERRALEHSDYRIYISNLTKRIAESAYGKSDQTCKIVHNGIDPDSFSPSPTSNEYFLYVGGDAKRKGFDLLVEALEHHGDELSVPVKMVGEFDERRGDVQRALDNDLVDLYGRVDQDDLDDLYRGAIALVHPARYEPFGNVVLESLACGTPVIVSGPEYCGAAELVTDDVGMTVTPKDPTEIVDAMEVIEKRTRPELCRTIAEERTWKMVAEETLSLFD